MIVDFKVLEGVDVIVGGLVIGLLVSVIKVFFVLKIMLDDVGKVVDVVV